MGDFGDDEDIFGQGGQGGNSVLDLKHLCIFSPYQLLLTIKKIIFTHLDLYIKF